MTDYCVQGKYEGAWECLTHEVNKEDARTTRRIYDANEPSIAHRWVNGKNCPDENGD